MDIFEYFHHSLLSIDHTEQRLAMPSFRRLFCPSSPSVSGDLADLEECFHNNSFALVPSALTPSHAPSNSIIAATRALFFKRPVRLDFTSGLKKGPVINWYNEQGAKGSTEIKKIQLRKDYQHPYYHEYIIISTRSGHTYRVDRRPDPDAPFDTIMKTGCIAYDTIQEVDSTSLKELDRTSSCVVELHWRGKETIDMLFVLSICFAIHNDKMANRYTLQRYNCYFLSWAIIEITMRKSAVCGAMFTGERRWGLVQRVLRWAVWQGLARGLERELERERELGLERERELKRARVRALKLTLDLERRALVADGIKIVRRRQGIDQKYKLVHELVHKLMDELAVAVAPVRDLETARGLVREWEWAQGLGQIPLVLGLINNIALAKTVLSRQAHFVISLLCCLIYSNIARRA